MMANINVSPEELAQLSSLYLASAERLQQELQELLARSAPLREDWVGSSSSAFQQLNAQFESARQQLVDAMERIASALTAASDAYRSADSSISSAFEG